MQHQVVGVKLAVAMLKDDMSSTKTDLFSLPSPREWKVSISAREVELPPPQDSWLVFELPVYSYQFATLQRRDGGIDHLYRAA
jgi:hypothetical protein